MRRLQHRFIYSPSVTSVSHLELISPAEKVRCTHHAHPHKSIHQVTVGLATSFLSGSKEEWSLVRRHPSESIFGVQLAGNKPANLVPAAEVIARECGSNLDFVDLNCGCPIDLVFKSGSGSACGFCIPLYQYVSERLC
jgi:Dihydrouridine synthase (Dus)